MRPGLLYDRFCASADTMGCFGTQIWTIGSRLAEGVTLSVISAHAPHDFRTQKVKSTFWESVPAAFAFASAAGDEVAPLGDFNARLGSIGFAALGIHD